MKYLKQPTQRAQRGACRRNSVTAEVRQEAEDILKGLCTKVQLLKLARENEYPRAPEGGGRQETPGLWRQREEELSKEGEGPQQLWPLVKK